MSSFKRKTTFQKTIFFIIAIIFGLMFFNGLPGKTLSENLCYKQKLELKNSFNKIIISCMTVLKYAYIFHFNVKVFFYPFPLKLYLCFGNDSIIYCEFFNSKKLNYVYTYIYITFLNRIICSLKKRKSFKNLFLARATYFTFTLHINPALHPVPHVKQPILLFIVRNK